MDKLEKIIAEFLSEKFNEWKEYLTTEEQAVFALFYFKGYSIIKIAEETHYCDRTVKRYLRSARKKINKHLP